MDERKDLKLSLILYVENTIWEVVKCPTAQLQTCKQVRIPARSNIRALRQQTAGGLKSVDETICHFRRGYRTVIINGVIDLG